MPTPEQILMRKIKKREKQKLKIIAKKNNTVLFSADRKKKSAQDAKSKEISSDTENDLDQDLSTITEQSELNQTTEWQGRSQNPNESKKSKKNKIELGLAINKDSDSKENMEAYEKNECSEEKRCLDRCVCLDYDPSQTFSSLEITDATKKSLSEMGFTTMTEIQAITIPALLRGRNLIGQAKTGSGKTLAFLIPVVDFVYKMGHKPRNGTGVIVLSPTRELAMQTYGVLMELMKYHRHTHGLIMGGANRNAEARKLVKGVNILVATPGRLLDHMKNTPNFVYRLAMCLVIDEADRMMEIGFFDEIKQIVSMLPTYRQTILFSATRTEKTEALMSLIFKQRPLYRAISSDKATVETLQQGFLMCPSHKRMNFLFTFLKKYRNKKVMVFFSTGLSVKFHNDLFNYIDLPVMSIHGKQEQTKRTNTFFQFCNADSGILLCTDVAARGLDIPAVDWIVQYDPPDDPKEYIHRVGRTARGLGTSGQALILLRNEEIGFLKLLKDSKVTLNQYEFFWDKAANIQHPLEKLLCRNFTLKQSALDAYRSYLRSYDSHHLKNIFDINKLDLAQVAMSFGFASPPEVEFRVVAKRNKFELKKKKTIGRLSNKKNKNVPITT